MADLTMAMDLELGDRLDGNETVTKAPAPRGLHKGTVEFHTDKERYLVRADSLWWVHRQPPEWARDEKEDA